MNKGSKIYTEGFWYRNNYNSLGSDWLVESLQQLKLRENFKLANLSANAGWYENEAYNVIRKKMNPTFYVGDINANRLSDKKIQSHDGFIYLEGQRDAAEVTSDLLGNQKMDMIVDCKGALWYAAKYRKYNLRALKKLLTTYRNLLSEEGILLVDYYDECNFWQTIKFEISGGNKKEIQMESFGEFSTKYYLQKILRRNFMQKYFKELVVSRNENYPLTKYMRVAYISVEGLDEILKKISKRVSIC